MNKYYFGVGEILYTVKEKDYNKASQKLINYLMNEDPNWTEQFLDVIDIKAGLTYYSYENSTEI